MPEGDHIRAQAARDLVNGPAPESAAPVSYTHLNFAVSPDHRLLAYSIDLEGDESYTIRVKDLSTGQLLPDRIDNTYYTLEWANDNRTFFYTVLDAAKRPYRAFRHELGAASDALVYQEDLSLIHI